MSKDNHFNDNDLDLVEIAAAYRRQKLIEHMVGPVVATVFHIVLFFGLTVFIVFEKSEKDDSEIVVEQIVQEEVVMEEEPPELEEEETITDEPEMNPEASIDLQSEVADQGIDEEDSEDVNDMSSLDIQDFKSPLKSSLVSRSKAGQGAAVSKYGGTGKSIVAVDKALTWLAKQQNEDGSWGKIFPQEEAAEKKTGKQAPTARPMLTGMALLAFLAQGETHLSAKHGKTVRKAIVWLSERTLKYRFLIGDYGGPYPHCMGTYALCEAVGLTDINIARDAMEVAIAQMIKLQNKQGMVMAPGRSSNSTQINLMGWIYQAYTAAIVAGTINPEITSARDKSMLALKSHFVSGDLKGNSIGGYFNSSKDTPKGRLNSIPTYSPVGLLCMQLSGQSGKGDARKAYNSFKSYALKTAKWKPMAKGDDFPMSHHLYTWYYTTQIFFNKQGSDWKSWNKVFTKLFLNNQKSDGHWETPNPNEYTYTRIGGAQTKEHRMSDSRIYATALSSINLTVYYRNLPTLSKLEKKDTKTAEKAEEEIDELDIF